MQRVGPLEDGGIVRIGLTHDNTPAEVDRLVDALGRIAVRGTPNAVAAG
jgi:selenocysteine lyase/cysteine desulfurase